MAGFRLTGAPDSPRVLWRRAMGHSDEPTLSHARRNPTGLRLALFKVQMVRQIVDQNAIGIVGCMRPLLEHRAIADSKLRLNECS